MSIRAVKKIQNFVPVKNAFISVFDKSGVEFVVEKLFKICPRLRILSSGGTYTYLKKEMGDNEAEKRLREVSKYTGMPETDGGLVKTLHHKLFLGYLTESFNVLHQQDLKREKAVPIDLAIINLYPFAKIINDPESTFETARGNIDVGGPSALRAAAKNFLRVMTVSGHRSGEYDSLISEMQMRNGCTSLQTRFRACRETFNMLSAYDTAIANYMEKISYHEISDLYEFMKFEE